MSSLQQQLSQIAQNSTNSLNLKAQKAAHSKSLIFEPRVAASQSFDTLYAICHEGFQELCLLDGRFLEFQRNIFSEQSQEQDRTQMTATDSAQLDRKLEAFLGLVGGRLRLSPAIKAIEWLVRRFRIHEYNTSFLLTTFLPYHTLPTFTALLSILPSKIPNEYNFLHPYIRSLTSPQRRTIVNAATNIAVFTTVINSYVLRICRERQHYPALLAFWAGTMTEAIGGMLDRSRSGRKGVQQQNEQDVIMKLLPTLNEGLSMKKVPDLRVGCYMILSVLASKGGLEDSMLTAMMEAVVLGWTPESFRSGLVCLSVLAQHRGAKQITKRVTKELLKVPDLSTLLIQLCKERRIDKLANGLCLALVDRLNKNNDVDGLVLIVEIIRNQILSDAQITVAFKHLLVFAHKLDNSTEAQCIRGPLAASLVTLAQLSGHAGTIIQDTLRDVEIDMDDLEMRLHAVIRVKALPVADEEDTNMEGDNPRPDPNLEELLQDTAKYADKETSFLSPTNSHLYQNLCSAFLLAASSPDNLDMFDGHPILRKTSALEDPFYLSFYMRTWCGPLPVVARASAIQMVTRCLSGTVTSDIDIQAILPYAIAALGDSATKVRRAAAELIVQIEQLYPKVSTPKKKTKPVRWASDDIYGSGNDTKELKWLSVDVLCRLVREVLVPVLEECVLDKKHVESVFEKAMNSSKGVTDTPHLPQAARTSIMSFLASHVIQTPLYLVKYRLLLSLNQVRSIASLTRTKLLLPLLQQWASLSLAAAVKHCEDEQVDLAEYSAQAVLTVTTNDKEGLQYLASIVKGEIAADRPALLDAVFSRLRAMWPALKGDFRLQIAHMLLETSQAFPDQPQYNEKSTEEAGQLLRTIPLSTDILLQFLEKLPTAAELADAPPATKRRRTSHGEVAKSPIQDSKLLAAAIRQVTFVLQLIDSSNPGNHPELLESLFSVLAELQHFKTQVSSELAYLQTLVLSSLLAICQAFKLDHATKLERSAVRADLLVDCVQKTASPQVQNAALLLIASLAESAPELVLHSVMPIFTFMGSSVLRQNDEYSAHVISQTIREVIPPLISSLRKDKGNPVTGAAELLLSFVAAFEHVPAHRRRGLFTSLVQTLGAEDFLFALLAMLVDKYGITDEIKLFAVALSSAFSVEIQLQSAVRYFELVGDLLKPKPTFSVVLLAGNEELKPQESALKGLTVLPHLLSQKHLAAQTAKILNRDDMDSARIREIYSILLENLLALADSMKDQKQLHGACGDVLESLLGLLSTSEFVKSVEGLLDRPNESLRRKILKSLEVRIDHERPSDVVSRIAMLGFLPQLTAIIRESRDVLYKHTAVACVDKISEKYGKMDLEAVAAAAKTIASKDCLGQSDNRLRVMALLCLASLVEILKEGIVSILPVAIPKALEYMEASLAGEADSQKLHNAGYSFVSSLVQYLPDMVSGSFLEKLLSVSNASAEADLDEEADEGRMACLSLAAKRIDAKSMFTALEQDWSQASAAGSFALTEYLTVLSIAIEKHPQSLVTKHSRILAKILQSSFDLRRQWTVADEDTSEISSLEEEVNQVALKMIYKFGDSTCRPIFSALIEWASASLPKSDKVGRVLRLQSLYGFTSLFFDKLQYNVTSYATYLLDNAASVLTAVDVKTDAEKDLWTRVLLTLAKAFEHDQSEFWQAPAHFGVIAPVLTAQFLHASTLPLLDSLVPCIVELAAAADSSDHHKELNSAILKHLRSESTTVRLAAVKCEQALTDRLGEEWLSMLPEMLPFISELQEDDDETVEKETHRWIVKIEGVLGESLDSMLQ